MSGSTEEIFVTITFPTSESTRSVDGNTNVGSLVADMSNIQSIQFGGGFIIYQGDNIVQCDCSTVISDIYQAYGSGNALQIQVYPQVKVQLHYPVDGQSANDAKYITAYTNATIASIADSQGLGGFTNAWYESVPVDLNSTLADIGFKNDFIIYLSS
ncbi:hypothetical protein GGI00_003034 [Coemansia sp. RSA 2681]|nr:hypothetical protein GGI00_003034 [Coemansia sp. RSA 2681]